VYLVSASENANGKNIPEKFEITVAELSIKQKLFCGDSRQCKGIGLGWGVEPVILMRWLHLKQNNFTETKHCFAFVLFQFCFSFISVITTA